MRIPKGPVGPRSQDQAAESAPGSGNAGLSPEVLDGVRLRDPEALTAFYDAWFDRVFGLTYRLLGNRSAAEDATQEVFIKIYGAAHRLDPSRDPGPWVVTIAYNVCRDLWRSRRHKLDRLSSSLDEHPGLGERAGAAPGPGAEETVERGERAERVQAAILELPESLRTVVVLHDYQGLNHEEIARAVGASHAAVRKRYSRALNRLGELLKDLWP